jgi:predicted GNAT superfamily acetyltransferase
MSIDIRLLETHDEMLAVEKLELSVWPGSEIDVVPDHVLLTVAHNGGVVLGAFDEDVQPESESLVGFVFGFPGLYFTPDGPRPKHCSHMMGVLPDYRNLGIGFALKRAQWQMVRHQGLDRVTWTYDPLISRNAYLNIGKLGSVCNIYMREVYGNMRDSLNKGLPSDRFQVDWWVNTPRVISHLGKRARRPLVLDDYLSGGFEVINPITIDEDGWPNPMHIDIDSAGQFSVQGISLEGAKKSMVLVEIPPDFMSLKAVNAELALEWRLHTRTLFEALFSQGYLVTDFVHQPGDPSRSVYVLTHGESTL